MPFGLRCLPSHDIFTSHCLTYWYSIILYCLVLLKIRFGHNIGDLSQLSVNQYFIKRINYGKPPFSRNIINHRLHRYSLKSADIFNGNLVVIRSCLLNFFIYSQVSRIFQTLSRPGSPFERVARYGRTSKKIRRNRFSVPWLIERRKIDVRNISKIVRFFNTPGVVTFCVRNTACPHPYDALPWKIEQQTVNVFSRRIIFLLSCTPRKLLVR